MAERLGHLLLGSLCALHGTAVVSFFYVSLPFCGTSPGATTYGSHEVLSL